MSNRYKGGVLSATPPTTSSSAAPGIWTLEQQMQATAGTGWPFGGPFNYIEDVFSTWLYTGNSSTQTITNGIDLSGKGGLVWIKNRTGAISHALIDTARGGSQVLSSDTTSAQADYSPQGISAFNSSGFTVNGAATTINSSSYTYASWTFRKQPKFFDIVTYTGNGASSRSIAHNLGSAPGCVMVKRTDSTGDWYVYHQKNTSGVTVSGAKLNSTAVPTYLLDDWRSYFTATTFDPIYTSGDLSLTNINGATYVAYLFAHNAGGFGLTGTDNVISCGSFTTDGSGYIPTVNLGYEPQWVLAKPSSGTGNWFIMDNMRGWYNQQADQGNALFPNTSGAEAVGYNAMIPTATGFTGPAVNFGAGITYIYIAIRRGPMKVPTSGTSVYTSASRTGTAGVMPRWVAGFPVDWALRKSDVTTGGGDWQAGDRLRGAVQVKPNLTEAETSASPLYIFDGMTGYSTLGAAGSDTADRSWMFRRAPGFFDEVCYTGNGTGGTTITHNLGVAPELIICKARTDPGGLTPPWTVGFSFNATTFSYAFLNLTVAATNPASYSGQSTFPGQPTSTQFTVGTYAGVNYNTGTYVAYLFATCPGVSKVGSYTGTAALLTVNCGFTAGARFVLIKRTDSTGDWYVYDSARGISASTDPYLFINSTAAEVTGTNYVDTDTTGFKVTAAAPAGLNANGGTYIFLAIA